jgi:FKBP-type peptidyl-prolyl cis-trans isomerase FkpA
MQQVSGLVLAAVLAAAPAAANPAPSTPAPAPSPIEVNKKKGQDYLATIDGTPGVTKTPSGLRIKITKPGDGASPAASDTVNVHYRGTLIDGTEFDSSIKRGTPATFPLSGVIPCWTEGLQRMKPGGSATLYCPPEIAYGDRGYPPVIPPRSTLTFQVDLLSIDKPTAAAAK